MASLKFLNPETGEYEKIGIPSPEASGVQMKLLWENPNPNVNFAAQTINIDTTEYSFLIINHKYDVNNPDNITTIHTLGNTSMTLQYPASSAQMYRLFNVVENGLAFQECNKRPYGGSSSVDNGFNIPLKIYGIKGVS